MQKNLRVFARLSLAVLVLGHGANSFGETNHYRWLNERGETVYSDRPPEAGTDYQIISSSTNLKRSVTSEEGAVPPDDISNSPQNELEASANEAGGKNNPELCERAKMNLLALQGSHKVSIRDDQGQVRELSTEEREIAKQTAQATIDIYCE